MNERIERLEDMLFIWVDPYTETNPRIERPETRMNWLVVAIVRHWLIEDCQLPINLLDGFQT